MTGTETNRNCLQKQTTDYLRNGEADRTGKACNADCCIRTKQRECSVLLCLDDIFASWLHCRSRKQNTSRQGKQGSYEKVCLLKATKSYKQHTLLPKRNKILPHKKKNHEVYLHTRRRKSLRTRSLISDRTKSDLRALHFRNHKCANAMLTTRARKY
jgi:hypothetical protein